MNAATCIPQRSLNVGTLHRSRIVNGLTFSELYEDDLVEYNIVWFVNPLETKRRPLYLTLRRLMSYIYGAPILDVSRSHTTTHHSR